jgi:hypothetical protein
MKSMFYERQQLPIAATVACLLEVGDDHNWAGWAVWAVLAGKASWARVC